MHDEGANSDAEAAAPESSLSQSRFLVGLGLTTAAVLALEVLDTRLLSVVTWYSLAFLVIAMGLFGLTAGAVSVYLRPDDYTPARLSSSLAKDARRFALAIPASYLLLLVIPLRVEPVATTVVLFLLFSAAIALPFYPAGRIVAAALTRTPFPVGRVYAVDLLGAALGAPLVPALLRAVDGGTAILSLSALAALASVAFAGSERRGVRRGFALAAALATVTALNAGTSWGFVPLWVKGRPEERGRVVRELWNSHSRVQVTKKIETFAAMWGGGSRCRPAVVLQQGVEIDAHAATPLYLVDGDLEKLRFLECDVTNVVHRLRPKGSIAIIGVGGSRDIQAALLAGHDRIVGIELNDRLLELLDGELGQRTGVAGRPEVTLVHDEARSYLARHDERYDVIQASLIDTWAATGAGAHALGENGLYTVEAFRLFLRRLAPGGVLTVSRWATVETTRLVSLAVGALLAEGVQEPRRHLALLASGPVATLLVGRDPLTTDDERALQALAAEKGFHVVALPSVPSTLPRIESLLAASDRTELERTALEPDLDFRPPTDDRPFFFNVVRLQAMTRPLPEATAGSIEGNLLATRTLGLAMLSSLLLVLGAIVFPLLRRARPQGHVDRRLVAGLAYFATIGVGFMLAEIALLQRLSLVLGHPVYSLLVVLASLVGAAGLGSLASDRLPLARRPWCYVYPLVLAAVLLAIALGWDAMAAGMAGAPTATRIAFAVGVCVATGVPLGVAFPSGMRLVKGKLDDETPWLWGLNGVGSVLASSLAIVIALAYGLSILMLVAAACYAALVLPVWVLDRSPRAP